MEMQQHEAGGMWEQLLDFWRGGGTTRHSAAGWLTGEDSVRECDVKRPINKLSTAIGLSFFSSTAVKHFKLGQGSGLCLCVREATERATRLLTTSRSATASVGWCCAPSPFPFLSNLQIKPDHLSFSFLPPGNSMSTSTTSSSSSRHAVVVAAAAVAAAAVLAAVVRRTRAASHGRGKPSKTKLDALPTVVLRNQDGAEVHITPVGASIQRLIVPVGQGQALRDVVLGFNQPSTYAVSE